MKHIFILICFGISIFFIESCRKNNIESIQTFSYEQSAGIWVPYEMIYSDSTISQGPFTSSSIFGVYAESVRLNTDKTFIPVIWHSKDNFVLKTAEAGSFQYMQDSKKLIFNGVFHNGYEVVKFHNDEMWLKILGVTCKLKKQQ